jgi:hypothetical protein
MRDDRYIVRFQRPERIQHALLMVSFLGLAATGLPLLFSESGWARVLARVLGGFSSAGVLHRIFAVVLIGVFVFHVGRLAHRVFVRGERDLLWGPNSMVPQPRDLVELYGHVRWFLHRRVRAASLVSGAVLALAARLDLQHRDAGAR